MTANKVVIINDPANLNTVKLRKLLFLDQSHRVNKLKQKLFLK